MNFLESLNQDKETNLPFSWSIDEEEKERNVESR